MTVNQKIKPYDITNNEKVTYGYYSALEVVFQQFIGKLESYFFDEFKLAFDFSVELKTGIKFRNYFETLNKPAPLFVFNLFPFTRDSILKIDNCFINLILAKEELFKKGKIALGNGFSLENTNSSLVKSSIEKILDLFQDSWKNIYPVEYNLKRLVSNRIKARVMDLSESCVVIKLTMSQKAFHSSWEFCFSTYQLDRIIKKRGAQGLLAASSPQQLDQKIKDYLTRLLMQESEYEISGVLGTINLSSNQLFESFKNKTIIPIENNLKNRAVIKLNKTPILAADIGQTANQISLQIKNSYESFKNETQKERKNFSAIQFPQK
ncbi:hypothetical protein KJ966_10715 [bacterium]|nr:hypothetical protein [bacterium]